MSKTQKIMVVLASIMIVVASVMLFRTLREYKIAENEYDGLNKYVTTGAEEEAPDDWVPGETKQIKNGGVEKYQFARNYKRSDFPDMQIDFKGLREVNPEVVAWLYVGAVNISYPVVQKPEDKDNTYYLHHTFEQYRPEDPENSSGCIFMDSAVDPQLTSWNTFIYGHNMKNGSMFGSLRKFINNHKLYDKDPYIYIFREEGIYRYKIYSFYLDTPDSKMYWTCKTLKQYRAYVRTARENAVYDCKTPANEEDNTVTLVTCSGSGAGKKRFFVHGISQDCYLYPPSR